jgi:hypothetical protein
MESYYINSNDGLPLPFKLSRADSMMGGSKMPAELPKYPPEPSIIFLASKNETFKLGDNFKSFQKRLKNRVHKVIQ